MRTLMQRAIRQADLALYKTIAPKIWRLGWNTDIRHVGKEDTAVGYLARYISQSALSAKRILSDDGRHVRIAYTCSQGGQRKTLRLTGHEFVRRLQRNTLPNGFKRVRYYGWLSPAAHKRRAKIRELLAWKPTIPKEPVPTHKSPVLPPLPGPAQANPHLASQQSATLRHPPRDPASCLARPYSKSQRLVMKWSRRSIKEVLKPDLMK
jgi:hypothetical protein